MFRVSDVVNEGQEVEVHGAVGRRRAAADQPVAQGARSPSRAGGKAEPEEPDEPEAPPEPPKKRKVPLKGGIGGPASGEKFGLK